MAYRPGGSFWTITYSDPSHCILDGSSSTWQNDAATLSATSTRVTKHHTRVRVGTPDAIIGVDLARSGVAGSTGGRSTAAPRPAAPSPRHRTAGTDATLGSA